MKSLSNLSDPAAKIWFSLVAVCLLLVYYPIVSPLLERFGARESYYSHGYLVPFITAYLIWRKRQALAAVPLNGSWWGLPLILGGLAVHLISFFLRINFPSYLSLLTVLFGVVIFLGGWHLTRLLAVPLAFLIFMLPLPEVMVLNIAFKMKILATQISTELVSLAGMDVTFEGSKILFPGGFIWVGDPCSGLRSLISFLALGAVVVQLTDGNNWKKSILLVSVVPIAIFSNVIRIMVLTAASYIYGSQIAAGFLHDFMGIMVFVFGFVGLIIVMKVLKCHLSLGTA